VTRWWHKINLIFCKQRCRSFCLTNVGCTKSNTVAEAVTCEYDGRGDVNSVKCPHEKTLTDLDRLSSHVFRQVDLCHNTQHFVSNPKKLVSFVGAYLPAMETRGNSARNLNSSKN